MKNPKEIEKKLEKEIEKKREKEIVKEKIEKLEKPELKEKPEKREIKEFKEIKELKEKDKDKDKEKEIKEPFKEKVEVKEIKEFDKQINEKGGKELVETVDPTEGIRTRSADLTADAQKPKDDEVAKQKDLDKPIDKIKPEKEVAEKIQKEIEKIKPEKEHLEKVQKDIEKIKPEKEFSKHEIKEIKEFPEKHIRKDYLPDKYVFENDPKGIVENPGTIPTLDPVDRRTLFNASTPDDRLTQLEEAVTKLSHFIGVDLRPDLSTGALRSETDQAEQPKPEEKTDDKNRKK